MTSWKMLTKAEDSTCAVYYWKEQCYIKVY